MTNLKVRDLMTSEVLSLNANDTLEKLYDAMDANHFRHMPVINDDGDLVGLVTHRDLIKNALGAAEELPVGMQRDLLQQTKVGEVMTVEPETVSAETDLASAGQLLLEYKFGCLPVVEGDQLVGILTEADFVRHVVDSQG